MKRTNTRKLAVLMLLGTSMVLIGFSCDWFLRPRRVLAVEMAAAPQQKIVTEIPNSAPPVVRDFLSA